MHKLKLKTLTLWIKYYLNILFICFYVQYIYVNVIICIMFLFIYFSLWRQIYLIIISQCKTYRVHFHISICPLLLILGVKYDLSTSTVSSRDEHLLNTSRSLFPVCAPLGMNRLHLVWSQMQRVDALPEIPLSNSDPTFMCTWQSCFLEMCERLL